MSIWQLRRKDAFLIDAILSCWGTKMRMLVIPTMSSVRVDDVRERWKTLLIILEVEETHCVPLAPEAPQTRRRETKRVAWQFVRCHLASKNDVVIHHITKAVSSCVGFHRRIFPLVGVHYSHCNGVKQLLTSPHFTF